METKILNRNFYKTVEELTEYNDHSTAAAYVVGKYLEEVREMCKDEKENTFRKYFYERMEICLTEIYDNLEQIREEHYQSKIGITEKNQVLRAMYLDLALQYVKDIFGDQEHTRIHKCL